MIMASMSISEPARSRPPSASLSYTILASKCITKLARLRPPSESLSYLISASRCISKPAQSRHPSASLSSTRSRPPRAFPNSLDHSLQVYLSTPPITASKFVRLGLPVSTITASQRIFRFARSRPRSVSLSSFECHFQAHLELLSSTACIQSRYTVCRWVAIYGYIDTKMRLQTEYMSFKNRETISSSYDFQVHRKRLETRCFSQTALL
jgi:hypothetical protein